MKLTLLRKFSLMSFLVISILGIVLAFSYSRYFQNQVMMVSAERTADTAKILIAYALRPEDFSGQMNAKRYDSLRNVFRENVLADEIKRVKVWNDQGKLVFSDEESLLAKQLVPDDGFYEAKEGKLNARLSDLDVIQIKNLGLEAGKQYVELYVPIRLAGSKEIIGVFEVYREADSLYETILEGQKYGRFFIGLSLLFLYVSLYQIVKKASQTLEEQDFALNDLTNRLDETLETQEQTHVGTIKALLSALDAKDKYTAGHSNRVTDYAMLLGRGLELEEDQLRLLQEASLFHDIGKIGIPESILNKRDTLTTDEYEFIKKHSTIGADIVESIKSFEEHADIVRHHHERFDGRGYPDQLAGKDIPLLARILAVADTYDAMTSDRPYRMRMPKDKALIVIRECSGSQFDPDLVEVFLRLVK